MAMSLYVGQVVRIRCQCACEVDTPGERVTPCVAVCLELSQEAWSALRGSLGGHGDGIVRQLELAVKSQVGRGSEFLSLGQVRGGLASRLGGDGASGIVAYSRVAEVHDLRRPGIPVEGLRVDLGSQALDQQLAVLAIPPGFPRLAPERRVAARRRVGERAVADRV